MRQGTISTISILLFGLVVAAGCRADPKVIDPASRGFEGDTATVVTPPGESFTPILPTEAAPESFRVNRQRRRNWCWAACIEGVLNQAGIPQSQEQIAARLTGWPQDRPAHLGEIVALLQSYRLRSWTVARPASPQELANTLRSGWKVIAFVNPMGGQVGHFILLEGMDAQGFIHASDPLDGVTRAYTPQDLYYGWAWTASAVVGR